jgi:hypothetical protein
MLRSQQERKEKACLLVEGPEGLLAPLNKPVKSKRTGEVIELLRLLQEIEIAEGEWAGIDRILSLSPNYQPLGRVPASSHLYVKVNEILSDFQWSPRIERPPNKPYSFTWNAPTHVADWENRFVFWLLNQRSSGDLLRIRNCRNCGQWFYAVTGHQTSCTDRCRQQFHSMDTTFKEKRRLYMRKYRKNEKGLDLSAIKLVQKKHWGAGDERSPKATRKKKGGS